MSKHVIACKRTGEVLASKLDGGTCACPSAADCRMARVDPTAAIDHVDLRQVVEATAQRIAESAVLERYNQAMSLRVKEAAEIEIHKLLVAAGKSDGN